MSKVKDKEKIIKTARENSYIQGNTHKTMNRYFSTKFSGQKGIAQYIQSAERKKPSNSARKSCPYELKEFSRQAKVKEVHHH